MKFILKYFGKTIKESLLEEGKEYFIGRHEDCDFILQETAGLSRKHIKIYQSAETGSWLVESLSDLGGLYLDGEEIESVELEESCSLTLKNYSFEFIKEENVKEQEEKSLVSQSVALSHMQDEKEQSFTAGTKVLSDSDFIYSLYVYIEGEMSDHINLNQSESWTVGRSEDCDISIDYSILTRKHLKITKKQKSFYVEDLGSSNKTFLNNKELEPHKAVLLKPNDEISISDLKMLFEVRHKNFDKMMENLKDSVSEDSNEAGNLPEFVAPKVVLEDVPYEKETSSFKSKKFFKNKQKILLAFFVVFGLGLYLWYNSNQTKKELPEPKPINELEILYEEILDKNIKKLFQLCIDQIEELHKKAGGVFKDSQRILAECKLGLGFQQKIEETEKLEEEQKKTNAKIQKIVEECKKQYEEKKIQTEGELDQCAEGLRGLSNDGDPQIEKIRQEIQNKKVVESLKKKSKKNIK